MSVACYSFTASRDWCFSRAFEATGLRATATEIGGGGTVVRCWVPRRPDPVGRRPLLLLHGFGANTTWQWSGYLGSLIRAGFDLYVPDLLFFGGSHSDQHHRSDSFQAACIGAAVEALGLHRYSIAGVSYGGFVAYRMAAMFPDAVERVVLCCAGVCIEERDLAEGLFAVSDLDEAASILLPQSPDRLRQLMKLSFCKLPPPIPSCFLTDYIHVMCSNYVKEKTELLYALIKDRKLSDLPKITQPTLIIWGEQDKIFPQELGYRLNRHLQENSELVIIKNAGHAVNLEKPKELLKHMKAFLGDHSAKTSSKNKAKRWKLTSNEIGLSLKKFASNIPLLRGENT